MSVQVSTGDDGSTKIDIAGRFDFNVHQEFRDSYESTGTPDGVFLVDLGGAEYMDSSALGMLLVMREWAGGSNADISLINCSPEIRKLLEIANYEKLFKINEAVT